MRERLAEQIAADDSLVYGISDHPRRNSITLASRPRRCHHRQTPALTHGKRPADSHRVAVPFNELRGRP